MSDATTDSLLQPRVARLPLLDSARTFAAIGVIAAHVHRRVVSPATRLKLIGTYAVPFYLFVALYFTVRGLTRDASRDLSTSYLIGRVDQSCIVPFIVWNITYDVMHIVIHRRDVADAESRCCRGRRFTRTCISCRSC